MEVNTSDIEKIVKSYKGKRGILIPLLQEIQGKFGYVPRESIPIIAGEFGIKPVDIYGVLTFYAQFYLTPRGKHVIRVCQGTACYILGGKEILDHLSHELGIEPGETTGDGNFTLETVACLGCCGMGPVVAVDDTLHGECTIQSMNAILDELRTKEKV